MTNYLSTTTASYFPTSLHPEYMGAYPPTSSYMGSLYENPHVSYFQNYRNEVISRFTMPSGQFGRWNTMYSPQPDLVAAARLKDWRSLDVTPNNITTVDNARQQEVDDFYKICQMHREQYRDHSGRLHPLDYFKLADVPWQCPYDATTAYLRYPTRFNRGPDVYCLPWTMERVGPMPPLPGRCLAGRFNMASDVTYKR